MKELDIVLKYKYNNNYMVIVSRLLSMKKRILLVIGLLCVSGLLYAEVTPAEQEVIARLRKIGADFAKNGSDPLFAGLRAFKNRAINPFDTAKFDLEIRQVMDDLKNDPENDISHIVDELDRERAGDAEYDHQKELNAIKWQNTVLTDPRNKFALYKKDIIEVGLLAADVAADVKLYRILTNRRIDHVYSSLIKDFNGCIALLQRTKDSEGRYDGRMEDMSTFAQMFTDTVRGRDVLLNPLRRYLSENHALLKGYSPFNKKTLVPLLARWGWEKVSDFLESKLLVSPDSAIEECMESAKNFFLNPLSGAEKIGTSIEKLGAHATAYESNDLGYVRPLDSGSVPPVSVTLGLYGLLSLVNPTKGIPKILKKLSLGINSAVGDMLNVTGGFYGFGVPKFLFSKTAQLGFEILGIGFSAHFYDSTNSEKWTTFVLVNREELLTKLRAYKRALDQASDGEEALVEARADLREFVERGHAISTWKGLSNWWDVRATGKHYIKSRLFWGGLTIVGLRLGYWWLTKDR